MSRPLVIDWYCCEGGVSEGLAAAGFDVLGVDLFKHTNAQGKRVGFSRHRYPFPALQADAIASMWHLLGGRGLRFDDGRTIGLDDVAANLGSPPCHRHTAGTRALDRSGYPDLIGPTRELFQAMEAKAGVPWVIENTPDAPLDRATSVLLCGSMFGLETEDEDGLRLRLEKHRRFESSLTIPQPEHTHSAAYPAGTYTGGRGRKPGQTAAEHRWDCRYVRHGGYVPASHAVRARLLGLEPGRMTGAGMAQAIPPAYAEYVGRHLMAAIRDEEAA